MPDFAALDERVDAVHEDVSDLRESHAERIETLEEELFKREVVLAYLIENGLNTYTQVAATVQAFINDEETILALMANDQLERSLEDLREMESVLIDIDPEKEAMVPRPDPNEEGLELCADLLERAESELLEAYRGEPVPGIDTALTDIDPASDVTADTGTESTVDAGLSVVDDADTDAPDEAVDLDDGSLFDEADDADDADDGSLFDEADDADDADDGSLFDEADDADDEFGISFDDGPSNTPTEAGVDDWDTSDDDGTTAEADEMAADADTDDAATDIDADDDESDAGDSDVDMDEWGFGDVTDADADADEED